MKVLSASEVAKIYATHSSAHLKNYWGFYSSAIAGVCLDPAMMLVPLDDHLVHRGDGVFEALKITNGGIYLLDAHLLRLMRSAGRIELRLPWSELEIRDLVISTARAVLGPRAATEASLRIFLSRGPGSFGAVPQDSIGTQLYIVVTAPAKVTAEKFRAGVKTGRSQVPVKPGWYAQVKSCNYLPNVMMKKEAMERGLDFTISFDEAGFMAEGSTENVLIIDQHGRLQRPSFERMLQGTTLVRVIELAQAAGLFSVNSETQIREQDLVDCQGAFMVGTTLDVLPIAEYAGHKIKRSSQSEALLQLLRNDQRPGSPVWVSI